MTRTRITALALLGAVALVLAPATAGAQKKKRKPADAEQIERRRDKIKQKIRAMREWKLTEALELDEATANKLFPILDGYDEKFVAVMKKGGELRRKLRKNLDGNAKDAAINGIVDDLLDNQREIWDLNEKRFKAARKVLSAEQAAKALIVLPQIDQAIRRQLRKAVDGGGRGADGRRRRGGKRRMQ
jgi:Spy/CpxP family protein refolding chaperone